MNSSPFFEICPAFVPQKLERPLRDRHRPGETGQHRVLVPEMPQHLRKLVEELRFLVGMDRDLLIEQPAEDFVAFLELPPVAFRTVGLRMNQRVLPAHEVELAALVRRLHPLHHLGEAVGNVVERMGRPFIVERQLRIAFQGVQVAFDPLQVLLGRGCPPGGMRSPTVGTVRSSSTSMYMG